MIREPLKGFVGKSCYKLMFDIIPYLNDLRTLNFRAGIFLIEGPRNIIKINSKGIGNLSANVNNTMAQDEREDFSSLLLNLHLNINYLASHKCIFFSQGPDEWETLNGNWSCNGRKQSPINVMTDQVMQKDPTNPPNLRLTVAGNKPITGEFRNNGYAPTFYLEEELTVKLAGGLLQENYFLKQFHFHFGCNDTVGSEHTIDGNTYPIEVSSIVFI